MSFKSKTKGLGLLLIGAGAGAVATYLYDPDRGQGRRSQAADQFGAAMRDAADEARRQAEFTAGRVKGAAIDSLNLTGNPPADDRELKHRVETRVLGRESMPKGAVVVHAENGIVQLRGEVPTQSLIDETVARTREVDGVRAVENLLHLPGEPEPSAAPSREASRAASEDADAVGRSR